MFNKKFYPFIVAVSAILFFIPFLGSVHLFDWDEINFAESAREMLVTGNFTRVQIDFQPFWEKPPLFFWTQAGCMKLLGINEFAARLPDAIFGIVSLMTLFFLGKTLHNERFGFIWAIAYMGSFLPHLYFKSGIIDPVFNYFIFITVFFIFRCIKEPPGKKSLMFALAGGIAIGLATLTKGPVGFLIVAISVLIYWISIRFKPFTSSKNIFAFALAFILVSSLWFGLEVMTNGFHLMKEFIKYQMDLFLKPVAGHSGPVYYHFLIVFFGCFPISVLSLSMIFGKKPGWLGTEAVYFKWMIILFWVVMILFTIVRTKIVHYSSLAYYPLSYLAACFINDIVMNTGRLKKFHILMIVFTGTVISVFMAGIPLLAQNKELILPYINDPFVAACLNSLVKWQGFEFLIGIFYFIAVIFSVMMLMRQKFFKAFVTLFYSTCVCLFFYLFLVVPKIEQYSQGPVINFLKKMSGKDVYVTTMGFYSYAPYFYFNKMPGEKIRSSNNDSLLTAVIDKPVYLIGKVSSRWKFEQYSDCHFIKEEGGYLFFVRMPVK